MLKYHTKYDIILTEILLTLTNKIKNKNYIEGIGEH